ncbi:hypothetical protein FXN61_41450 [Lentzea sp. PSKA42]|uniref:Nucleotidyltransferase domain-containing protein n=1 Tax=Lentzea indica TaxID=2604800 RepID=A0ABX1FW82_9PSEU|nr:hypothetical protein [Lentzea indica]NKE62846.1 hypothetical protein [Lentzea indica]
MRGFRRFAATVLGETTADAETASAEELETAAHLWLMGSWRRSTATRPMHDVDLLVSRADHDDDNNTGEILRRFRNLYAHADFPGPEKRTSVRIECLSAHADEQVDVLPVFEHCPAEAAEQPPSDRFRQLARLLKWHFAHERVAASNPGDQDEHGDRCPRSWHIELWLLLLAAEAPEIAKDGQNHTRGGWLAETADTWCTAEHDTVVVYLPQLTDDQVVSAWRVARDRFQQTQEKVRLLESSSLGTARSRSARRRTAPSAVREVLKRVRTDPDPQ